MANVSRKSIVAVSSQTRTVAVAGDSSHQRIIWRGGGGRRSVDGCRQRQGRIGIILRIVNVEQDIEKDAQNPIAVSFDASPQIGKLVEGSVFAAAAVVVGGGGWIVWNGAERISEFDQTVGCRGDHLHGILGKFGFHIDRDFLRSPGKGNQSNNGSSHQENGSHRRRVHSPFRQ